MGRENDKKAKPHEYGPADKFTYLGAAAMLLIGFAQAAFYMHVQDAGGVFCGAFFFGTGFGWLFCPCRIIKRGDQP